MAHLPKHILVIRLSAMGDVAMTIPVLRAFIEKYPNVKISVLTRSFFSPFFRDLNNVTVYPIDVKGKHKGIIGLYRLSKELRKLHIGFVADLHNVLRSTLLKIFLFGIKGVQVHKGRSKKNALVAGSAFKQLKTTHQRYAEVFEKLGFHLDLKNPIYPNKYSLSQSLTSMLGEKNNNWIGIAPFAQHESKMYPLELMKKVIKTLSTSYSILLFGGGQKEVEVLKSIEKDNENVTNLAGRLTLNEELDIISNLDVMLSMDSGNAHIAAMYGIPVVTIWGVTHPYAGFYPFNQQRANSLLADRKKYPKIPTSIYGNKYPENYKDAAGSINPKLVIDKIKFLIEV
jgi:ADP-heptose:LPS heptosyltransferase